MKKETYIANFINVSLLMLAFIAFLFFILNHLIFNSMQCLMLFFCLLIPIFIKMIIKDDINIFIQLIYFIFLIAHFILGEIFSFYIHITHYDTLFHFLTASYITYLGFSIIRKYLQKSFTKLQLVFAFLIGLVAEYIWEIIEYIIDDIFKTNMQRYAYNSIKLLGHIALYDTMKDMFITMLSCFITIIIIGILNKKHMN